MRLISFEGPIWRLLATHLADQPTVLAGAPEGRFHHSGQAAVYASLSAEGAGVAIRRYLTDGVPRLLVPMRLNAAMVADVRGDHLASVVWQDQRAVGRMATTWSISDAARQVGAQALLYSSRSRPELAHVAVFDASCLMIVGPPEPMPYLID